MTSYTCSHCQATTKAAGRLLPDLWMRSSRPGSAPTLTCPDCLSGPSSGTVQFNAPLPGTRSHKETDGMTQVLALLAVTPEPRSSAYFGSILGIPTLTVASYMGRLRQQGRVQRHTRRKNSGGYRWLLEPKGKAKAA